MSSIITHGARAPGYQMAEPIQVEIRLVRGGISLYDVHKDLEALRQGLRASDQSVDPKRNVDYLVRSASYEAQSASSRDAPVPFFWGIEPIVKPSKKWPVTGDPLEGANLLINTINAVAGDGGKLKGVEMDATSVATIASKASSLRHPIVLSTEASGAELSKNVGAKLQDVLLGEVSSMGQLNGFIERMDIHNRRRFWIFPIVGPKRILVEFPDNLRDIVLPAMGRLVLVEGIICYKTYNSQAYKLSLLDIKILEEEPMKLDYLTTPTSGDSTDDIREFRHAW